MELLVSINSPIAFGDEGYHVRIAQYIAQEKDYPVWVTFFETPVKKDGFSGSTLWNLVEAGFFLVFGFNDLILKILVPFISTFLVGIIIFILGKKMYDEKIGFFASVIAVALPSIVTYSVLMYRDALFIFFSSVFFFTLFMASKTNEKKYFLLSGIFAFLTMFTKTIGYIIFPLMFLTFIYDFYKKRNFFENLKSYIIIFIIFTIFFAPVILRQLIYFHTPFCDLGILFNTQGCWIDLYKQQYQPTGRTEEVGTEVSLLKMGLINYLDFAYGTFWFIPWVILIFFCGLFLIIKRIEKRDIFLIFIFISFLPVFKIIYQGRAEDTARYTLTLIPPIALIAGNYLKYLYDFIKKYIKQFAIIVFIVIIVLSFFNMKSKLDVARHCDSSGNCVGYKMFSPLFFEACDWVKKNLPEDTRLGGVVWGSATVYNCQRDTGGGGPDVVYSKNLTLALSVLKMQNVTHLFIQKFSIGWNDEKLADKYPISYIEFLENDPDHFKKIYENGPLLQQCKQMGGCDGSIIYEVNYTGVKLMPLV